MISKTVYPRGQTVFNTSTKKMERINIKSVPPVRVTKTATMYLGSGSINISFNVSASKLLALKQEDKIGFDWDGNKLYLIIPEPNGFTVKKYSSTFSTSSSKLRAKIEKLVGKSNPKFEIEEFKEGRWPLKLL